MNPRDGGAVPLFDAGAQAERTALAWQRTGLAATAVGALTTHALGSPAWPGILLLAAGLAAAGLVGPLRYRHILRAVHEGTSPGSAVAVAGPATLLAAVIVGVAVSALVG